MTEQLPARGSVIASGSEVLLYAGGGPSGGATVPNLAGMTYAEARDALAARGLFIASGGAAAEEGRLVSGQDTAAGTDVGPGAVITVTLYDNDESLLGIY